MGTSVRWLNTMADSDCVGPDTAAPSVDLAKEALSRLAIRRLGADRRRKRTTPSSAPFQLSPGCQTWPVEARSTPQRSAKDRASADAGTLGSLAIFELLRIRIAHPLAETLEPTLHFAPATVVVVTRAVTYFRRVTRLTGVPASSTHLSPPHRIGRIAGRCAASGLADGEIHRRHGTRRAPTQTGLLGLLVNRARPARRVGDLTIQGVVT